MKYNLNEVPLTGIQKVDQYGDAVKDATFAVYAADENYNMLSDLAVNGGEKVTVPENAVYGENGDIQNAKGESGEAVVAKALYTGTTGVDGMMIFMDENNNPYTLSRLKELLGTHFILREIKVPPGYRIVYKDIHLEIWSSGGEIAEASDVGEAIVDEDKIILRCRNTPQSGVRANANLMVTATRDLELRRPYTNPDMGYANPSNNIVYQKEDGTNFGTLFAVIFKYTGARDENGNFIYDSEDDWVPVVGNDREGYQLIPIGREIGPTRGLENALKVAKMSAEMNGINSVVFDKSANGDMQLTMDDLPGHISTYYHMLSEDNKKKAEYTVAYYWTDQDSLDKATAENTYRVFTFADPVNPNRHYSEFGRKFGATIQVPNLINRIFVQKMDETDAGNPQRVDGATFAIYRVEERTDGIKYYHNTDIPFPKEAIPDSNGVITVDGQQIKPYATDTTRSYEDGIHTGTAEFVYLPEGQYIIKEVNPPPGYKLNPSDVMIMITEDTIYANAGTVEDGVTVGRGPGYLVTPLTQFAAPGNLDNTLTWVYTRLLVSQVSDSFADAQDPTKIVGYLTKNNSYEHTVGNDETVKDLAYRTYLKYKAENFGSAFDYVPNEDRHLEGQIDPDGFRRLFTTAGWSHYAILQDYDYGMAQMNKIDEGFRPNYEDLRTETVKDENGNVVLDENGNPKTVDRNLMNLFSRSTYIRVTNVQDATLTLKKVDSATPSIGLAGAQFRLYRTENADGTGAKQYYGLDADGRVIWTDEQNALTVDTVDEGKGDKSFAGLTYGVYYLEEVRSPAGYMLPTEPIRFEIKSAALSLTSAPDGAGVDGELRRTDNAYIYTITVPNMSSYELPSTGGGGDAVYTVGGLLLIAIPLVTLVIGYKKKRGSERRLN